jgi:hypothetical protein
MSAVSGGEPKHGAAEDAGWVCEVVCGTAVGGTLWRSVQISRFAKIWVALLWANWYSQDAAGESFRLDDKECCSAVAKVWFSESYAYEQDARAGVRAKWVSRGKCAG